MAPWGFLATAAACAVFPQQKGVILVVSAVGSLVRGGRRRKAHRDPHQSTASTLSLAAFGEGSAGVTLEWGQVECTIDDKKKKLTKELLSNIWGRAQPGRVLAIMGPSGAGKTTLLNVLAGQLPASGSGRTVLTGDISVDGAPLEQSRHKQAYIRQEDAFFSQLTVRETLTFAAKLQLPATLTEAQKEQRVDELLKSMGLAKVKDSIVGSAKVRGISGGERKRLSVACELLGNPSLIFADEPTTGLDAFQAEKVMDTLRSLAHVQGKTVIASIHQPRGSVYDMFDDIILMSEGKVVYFGPAKEEAIKFFADAGYPCPEHCNPAEHVADLVAVDHSSSEAEASSLSRLQALIERYSTLYPMPAGIGQAHTPPTPSADGVANEEGGEIESKKKKRIGVVGMFKLLLSRAWKQSVRDKQTNFVRAAMNITSALIFGSIFWRMGLSQTSIQDRMGLLQVAAINTAMASLTKTLNVFPGERQIAQREVGKGEYTVGAYFAAKLAAELPIGAIFPALFGFVMYPMTGLHKTLGRFGRFLLLTTVESFTSSAMGLTVGCIAPSTEAAMALGPSIMTVFIVFGGYYVNPDNTPFIFRWIPNISLIRWAFQGLSANEFCGLKFDASKPGDLATGEQVLQRLSFDKTNVNDALKEALSKELSILAFWYWASLYLLQRKEPRYVSLLPPRSHKGNGCA